VTPSRRHSGSPARIEPLTYTPGSARRRTLAPTSARLQAALPSSSPSRAAAREQLSELRQALLTKDAALAAAARESDAAADTIDSLREELASERAQLAAERERGRALLRKSRASHDFSCTSVDSAAVIAAQRQAAAAQAALELERTARAAAETALREFRTLRAAADRRVSRLQTERDALVSRSVSLEEELAASRQTVAALRARVTDAELRAERARCDAAQAEGHADALHAETTKREAADYAKLRSLFHARSLAIKLRLNADGAAIGATADQLWATARRDGIFGMPALWDSFITSALLGRDARGLASPGFDSPAPRPFIAHSTPWTPQAGGSSRWTDAE
jgi:predicted  nucleic acid-binding Zn-ribbon protein